MKPKFQDPFKNEVRVIDLSRSDVKSLIAEVIDEKFNQFSALLNVSNSQTGRYWTRKETAKILSITLPTLRQWTKDGRIKSYEIGARVLYKPEDIDNALREQPWGVRK